MTLLGQSIHNQDITDTSHSSQTIQENLTVSKTDKISTQLDTFKQEHLKVLTELTKGIESKPSFSTSSGLDSSKQPRGFILRISPNVHDKPAIFTVEWEETL